VAASKFCSCSGDNEKHERDVKEHPSAACAAGQRRKHNTLTLIVHDPRIERTRPRRIAAASGRDRTRRDLARRHLAIAAFTGTEIRRSTALVFAFCARFDGGFGFLGKLGRVGQTMRARNTTRTIVVIEFLDPEMNREAAKR
jgi:hypothetical protein